MKKLFLFIICFIFLSSCEKFYKNVEFKDRIIVPKENFVLNDNILKTDGYYYSKKIQIRHCKRISENNSQKVIPESKYYAKYIEALIIYKDGSIYYPASSPFFGVQFSNDDSYDYCDQVNNENNYNNSIQNFENFLNTFQFKNNRRYEMGVFEKGVYNVYDNKMNLQSYQGSPMYEYTIEQVAKILNDSTFVIESIDYYEKKNTEILKDTFRFKKFENIPKPICYILNNREEFGE